MSLKYDDQFKADVVALVRWGGVTGKQVRRDMGVSRSTLFHWLQDDEAARRGLLGVSSRSERADLSKALKRIKDLEMENEVLGRAGAYLS